MISIWKKNIYTKFYGWLVKSILKENNPKLERSHRDWILLMGLVQASAFRDLETSADHAGQGPFLALGLWVCTLRNQILRAQWITASGCFFSSCCGKKKCTVYIINWFAKISENSEMKLLAINSISNVVVNWPGSISCAKVRCLLILPLRVTAAWDFSLCFHFEGWAMLQKM